MSVQFYTDEDFPAPVVERLRFLGYDLLTAYDDQLANRGVDDETLLARAISLQRAVLTRNRRHFVRLHHKNAIHEGIVVYTHDPDFDAMAARIHMLVSQHASLVGMLIRVVRPSC